MKTDTVTRWTRGLMMTALSGLSFISHSGYASNTSNASPGMTASTVSQARPACRMARADGFPSHFMQLRLCWLQQHSAQSSPARNRQEDEMDDDSNSDGRTHQIPTCSN